MIALRVFHFGTKSKENNKILKNKPGHAPFVIDKYPKTQLQTSLYYSLLKIQIVEKVMNNFQVTSGDKISKNVFSRQQLWMGFTYTLLNHLMKIIFYYISKFLKNILKTQKRKFS